MSLLSSFLTDITASLRVKDGRRITELIHLDVEGLTSDRQRPYVQLNAELNSQYPKNNDAALSDRCRAAVPDHEFTTFTSPFSESLVRYFRYLRDFPSTDNLTRALEIRSLTSHCVTALGDSRYGIVMIPIVLSFSRTLATIAANLDRNPDLVRQANLLPSSEGSKVSFVDATANVLREAFIKCLAGSPGTPRLSRPTPSDKRIGIYLTANSVLALLDRSGNLRNATQIFTSIETQSPPLSFYPAAQRVTYLYYLGRYHFANNHFLRAHIVLESAYRQCHPQFLSHRRLILIYLIASNLTLGRMPSIQLLTLPECSSFGSVFMNLIRLIKSGDIGSFHRFLDLPPAPTTSQQTPPPPHTQFLLSHAILLPLRSRCEVFVWRSLIRRTFLISGYIPPPTPSDPNSIEAADAARRIPYLYLNHVRTAALFSFARTPSIYYDTITNYVHPDFQGVAEAVKESGYDIDGEEYYDDDDEADAEGEDDMDEADLENHPPSDAEGNAGDANTPNSNTNSNSSADPELNPEHPLYKFLPLSLRLSAEHYPSIYAIESTFLSLIYQGFLNGFVVKNAPNASANASGDIDDLKPRWALAGAKQRGGALPFGFPVLYSQIIERVRAATEKEGGSEVDVIPGWVREEDLVRRAGGEGARVAGMGGSMAGRVVRLSGVRGFGAGM